MDRALFLQKFYGARPMKKKRMMKILKESIDSNLYDGNPRGHKNMIIVLEELGELTQEVSKHLRGKGDNTGLLEEVADVQLGIYYLQNIANIDDVSLKKAMAVKMERLEKVLKDNGRYK